MLSDHELIKLIKPSGLKMKIYSPIRYKIHTVMRPDFVLPLMTWSHMRIALRSKFCASVSVVRNPPGWEVGIYLVGFFVLLGVAGLNIWKLWKSGTFPAPSPFPNFDYRYLQEKYGNSFSEVRQKVDLSSCYVEM